MRHALAVFAVLHGLAHLPGWQTRLHGGWVWLALVGAFGACAAGIWLRSAWWLAALTATVAGSVVSCAKAWPEARYGLAANAVALVLITLAIRFPGEHAAVLPGELDQLWNSPPAVRLVMQGEIRLGGRWHPFAGEQVISGKQGMIWSATVSLFGFLPIQGSDRIIGGAGRMSWWLFGLLPVARAKGPDVTRSALARWEGEALAWLPEAASSTSGIRVETDSQGRVRSFSFDRWGNPDGGAWRLLPFGVMVEEERIFAGRTIPSRIRAGWYFDRDRFERDGEFFRAAITSAVWRTTSRR
jgi:hypothetical protein